MGTESWRNISPLYPKAFASIILQLLDNTEQAAEMGKKRREWVLRNRKENVEVIKA